MPSHENISFAYFLACEVGGSKFLDNSAMSIQQGIIEHNMRIYQTVFPFLVRRRIPFAFTSSSLQAQVGINSSNHWLITNFDSCASFVHSSLPTLHPNPQLHTSPPSPPTPFQPTAYGGVKRLGERWVESLGGLGRSVRLWNIYGAEPIGVRSHVLSDWVAHCARDARVQAVTDGYEARQVPTHATHAYRHSFPEFADIG